jgi:signal peptidase I
LKALVNGANIIVSLMLAGVAIGLATVSLPVFGNHALIVRSASMQPTIPVGGIIVVSPQQHILAPQPALVAPKYAVGDIIAFRNETNQKLITTHRIVGAEVKDGKVFYQTKGDANNAPDNNLVAEENIIGKEWLSAPFIGRLFAFTKTNIGFPLLVIFPALLVIIFESINIFKEFKKQKEISQNQFPSGINLAGLKVLVPVVISVLVIQSSFAFFSDTAQSTNNTFVAGQFGPPVADHIVISEVQIHGANANQDFVELYNPMSSSVGLSGWKLRKRTSNGTESSLVVIGNGKSIPSHGFFLWANDQGGYSTSVGADESNSNNISENNSVALLTPTDVLVDQVAWGNGTNQFVEGTAYPNSPATSQSIERKAYSTSTQASMITGGSDEFKGDGFDSNNNSTDFILRSISQPQNTSSPIEIP